MEMAGVDSMRLEMSNGSSIEIAPIARVLRSLSTFYFILPFPFSFPATVCLLSLLSFSKYKLKGLKGGSDAKRKSVVLRGAVALVNQGHGKMKGWRIRRCDDSFAWCH